MLPASNQSSNSASAKLRQQKTHRPAFLLPCSQTLPEHPLRQQELNSVAQTEVRIVIRDALRYPRYLDETTREDTGPTADPCAFPERQAGGTTGHLKWHVTSLSECTKWFRPWYLLSAYFCFLTPYSFTTETLPIFKMVPLSISISDRFHSLPSGPNDLLSLGQSLYLQFPWGSYRVLEGWRGYINRIFKSIPPTQKQHPISNVQLLVRQNHFVKQKVGTHKSSLHISVWLFFFFFGFFEVSVSDLLDWNNKNAGLLTAPAWWKYREKTSSLIIPAQQMDP